MKKSASTRRARASRFAVRYLASLLAAALAAGCGDAPARGGGADPTAPTSAPARDAYFQHERDSVDFGTIYPMSVHATTFDLVAAGSEDLIVEQILRSCGCAQGELFAVGEDGETSPVELGRPYVPGTAFELHTELNTKGKSGRLRQTVRIVLAGRAEHAVFTLYSLVEPFLVCDPAALDFESFATNELKTGEVDVRARGGERFHLACLEDVLPEALRVSFLPVDADEDGRATWWKMNVALAASTEVGTKKHKIIFVTDRENEGAEPGADGTLPAHRGEYYVRDAVRSRFECPKSLSLGLVERGSTTSVEFSLANVDPRYQALEPEVRLFSKDGDGSAFEWSDRFHVTVRTVAPGRNWDLALQGEAGPDAGPFGGLVGIKIGAPLEDVIWITFEGVFASGE